MVRDDGVAQAPPFQPRVLPWMLECFGPTISLDRQERNHRFIEEALELVQACGCTQSEAHQLVDYVYGRDQGDINQEIGGVMVTLAALCIANGFDMHAAGETELARIWTKIEKIRAKHAGKPKALIESASPANGVREATIEECAKACDRLKRFDPDAQKDYGKAIRALAALPTADGRAG